MGMEIRESILQASAIPYREFAGRMEFCLITNRKGKWGFPKGIIDPGDTAQETALKESEEEAGLSGRLEEPPLGNYLYHKWGAVLDVTCFLMAVTEQADDWEEADWRTRSWHTAEEARRLIRRRTLLDLLDAAVERLEVE